MKSGYKTDVEPLKIVAKTPATQVKKQTKKDRSLSSSVSLRSKNSLDSSSELESKKKSSDVEVKKQVIAVSKSLKNESEDSDINLTKRRQRASIRNR